MNTTIDTTLKGTYYIEDAKGNLLSEADNIITDAGMNRLFGNVPSSNYTTGSTPAYTQAFANNLGVLILGSSNTAATAGDTSIGSLIATSNYTQTTDTANTGSSYVINSSTGQATLTYTRSFQIIPNTSLTIRELGMNHTASTTASTENGIFSRAVLASPVTVASGETLFIRYRLVITFNCFIDHGTLSFAYGAGTTGTIGRAKTIMPYAPFFGMTSAGAPSDTLNDGVAYSTILPATVSTGDDELCKPLFEDFGNNDIRFTGDLTTSSGGVFGTPYTRRWKLITCGPSGQGTFQYGTMVAPTTLVTGAGSSMTSSSETYSTTPPQQFAIQHSAPNNTIGGGSNHTWSKRIRFIFPPNTFQTGISTGNSVAGVALFASSDDRISKAWLPRSIGSTGSTTAFRTATNSCLFTAFENLYGPFDTASDTYVGFDYVFNFTRASS